MVSKDLFPSTDMKTANKGIKVNTVFGDNFNTHLKYIIRS